MACKQNNVLFITGYAYAIKELSEKINNRPMLPLGYLSPIDTLTKLLNV